jgi:hypothetical protein
VSAVGLPRDVRADAWSIGPTDTGRQSSIAETRSSPARRSTRQRPTTRPPRGRGTHLQKPPSPFDPGAAVRLTVDARPHNDPLRCPFGEGATGPPPDSPQSTAGPLSYQVTSPIPVAVDGQQNPGRSVDDRRLTSQSVRLQGTQAEESDTPAPAPSATTLSGSHRP